MRYVIMAALLAASSGAALAQQSQWGAFQAGTGFGVGIQAADGAQLMFKCDKPGANSVYAVLAHRTSLVPPTTNPVMRSVRVRMDANAPFDDQWRVLDNTAMAVNKGNERSLAHLLGAMGDAKLLELLVYNDLKSRTPTTFKFDIAGVKVALEEVYASCKDKLPTA